MDKKKCPNCGKPFTPNSGKQIYCSNRCKVAYGRKLADGKEVKTGKDVPLPVKQNPAFTLNAEQYESINIGRRIKEICVEKKISVADILTFIEEKYTASKKKKDEPKLVDKTNVGDTTKLSKSEQLRIFTEKKYTNG